MKEMSSLEGMQTENCVSVNNVKSRRNTIHRDTLSAASAIYRGWFYRSFVALF